MKEAIENKRRKNIKNKANTKFGSNNINKIRKILNKENKIKIIIGMVIVVLIIIINNYTSLGLVFNKNIDSKDAIEVQLQTSNNKIVDYNGEILVYNNGIITFYNNYGKNTGKISLEDTLDVDINTCCEYIQVISKSKGLVYVYKNKYEVARIKVEGEIYSGNINSKGISIIEHSSNGNKTELGIYNSSGKKEYNIKLSGNIIGKYALSENSKYLAYIDINVNGISVQTNINLINLKNSNEIKKGEKTIYNADNDLAYDLYWVGSDIIVRFEETYGIFDCHLGDKETIQINDGQTILVNNFNKRCAYVKLNENGEYILNIKKILSKDTITIKLDDAPKYLKYEDGIVFVCYSKKIEAYNNFGIKIKQYDSDMVITEPIIYNKGRSIVMVVSNKLIMFTI